MRECPLKHWVVSAAQAKHLIERGATVLDTRNPVIWFWGHLPGSVRVTWQEFSQQKAPNQGKLLENRGVLEEKLRALGVSDRKPVIVVGYSHHRCSFGEEGRIVWMLRTLGHNSAAFVDGGGAALVEAGVPTVSGLTEPHPGDFTIQRTNSWEIQREELKARLEAEEVAIIDTRKPREYAGATPYGEQRGGHLPGALHFYFKDLLDEKGYLLPHDQIIAQLKHRGIERDTPVVAYCTGGIRSAFFTTILAELGFNNVKNYSGSMWEWSAAPERIYPLE